MKSNLTAELVDESFHSLTELPNYRGRVGVVREKTSGHFPVDDGNDAEVGNSKWTSTGDPKGRKRKQTVKDRLALSHEQTENKTGEENEDRESESEEKTMKQETENRELS